MRLTLRTLLAYLDDTLEATQAKIIGQKVAESDTARELIERIKEVTRRRRLTAPAAGPGGKIDPNTIADYLDNTITPEQSGEIEEICLASDMHLAEVAACHQILTLVLGEPVLVPPTARQRLYGLVKGPEAIPFRKAKSEPAAEEEFAESKETDETLRLGLPPFRRQGDFKQRLLLWGGGAVAAALLVLALIVILQPSEEPDRPPVDPNRHVKGKLDDKKDAKKKIPPKIEDPNDQPVEVAGGFLYVGQLLFLRAFLEVLNQQIQGDKGPVLFEVPPADPLPGEKVVASYKSPPANVPGILVQPGKDGWKRLNPANPDVFTNRPLVSLPGFRSAVQVGKNLKLTLWGAAPEIWPTLNPLFIRLHESLVILHPHDKLDLDLTLLRGRVVLTSLRADRPVQIRLRFPNPTQEDKLEFVDLALMAKDSEILVERFCLPYFLSGYQPFTKDPKHRDRIGPNAGMGYFVLAGAVRLKAYQLQPFVLEAPPGLAWLKWNSRGGGYSDPVFLKEMFPHFSVSPPLLPDLNKRKRAAMLDARNDLNGLLSGKDVEADLAGGLVPDDKKDPDRQEALRILCVRSRGALDDYTGLLDLLGDANKPADVRRTAIQTLEHWIVQRRDHDQILWPVLKDRYRREAEKIMELLRGLDNRDLLTDYLTSSSLILKEMASLRLAEVAKRNQMLKKKG